MMDSMLSVLAFAAVLVAFAVHITVLVFAVRAATRGRQTLFLRNAVLASFGAFVAAGGLLASSLAASVGLTAGQMSGIFTTLFGLALISLACASSYRARRDSSRSRQGESAAAR
jgi:hypothetical protein